MRPYLVCVCPQRYAERSSKAKVRKLQIPISIDEEILRLQVPMENTVTMAVSHALDQLAHKLLDHVLAKSKPPEVCTCSLRECLTPATIADGQSFHIFLEIEIEEFEDKVEFVAIGVDDIEKANNVWIVHFLQQ